MNGDQMLCLRSSAEFKPFVGDLQDLVRRSHSHLDVGCSSGGLIELLRGMSPSVELFGIDLSEERLAMARAGDFGAVLVQGDVNQPLPYADESFDTVTCFEVIEHLVAPGALAFELHRVLKHNGTLFLTTPNANALMRFVLQSKWYAMGDPSHLIFFSRFTLRVLLQRAGFHIERMWTDSRSPFGLQDSLMRRLGLGGQLCVLAKKRLT